MRYFGKYKYDISYRFIILQCNNTIPSNQKKNTNTELVQLTNQDEDDGYEEGEYVPSHGLIVAAVTLAEELDVGVELVVAEGLEHLGGGHEGG